MKKLLLLFSCFLSLVSFSQETNYKEYSYTEFIELVQEEKDTVFRLSNALIKFNPKTDQRYKDAFRGKGEPLYNPMEKIVIEKRIELDNVQFLARIYNEGNDGWIDGVLKDIHFKRDVILTEVQSLNVGSCIFDGIFDLDVLNCEPEGLDVFTSSYLSIRGSSFKKFYIFKNCFQSTDNTGYVAIQNNVFNGIGQRPTFNLGIYNTSSLQLRDNIINSNSVISLNFELQGNRFDITGNQFNSESVSLSYEKLSTRVNFTGNEFSSNIIFYTDQLNSKDDIDWHQLKDRLIATSFYTYSRETINTLYWRLDSLKRAQVKQQYIDSARYHNKSYFVNEIGLKGMFYDYYKSRYDTETANDVYLELKDFETKRMQVRYQQDPNFKTYFTWKVNQFLKVFSAYGTQPARAIIFSLYVIIFFALIYLFFPNSWDKHGRKRIMDRYRFFTKYMNRNAGIHEVYLEEQQDEILESEDFKTYMKNAEKHIPKFFMATAMPLYKWSVSGTRLSAAFLKRIDIMQGTWSELPATQRLWKSILLIGAFIIAIIYDLIIKILNALMLSINTFTTLGFGEIPIKGLPRYLAIIQGFIGWFMLTIFSVSLISQLLN